MKKLYFLIFLLIGTTSVFAQSSEEEQVNNHEFSKDKEIVGFKMYPNPVSDGNLFVTTQSDFEKEIEIFDVLGKKVLARKITKNYVNVSSLKSGVYILKVIQNNKSAVRKLVIK